MTTETEDQEGAGATRQLSDTPLMMSHEESQQSGDETRSRQARGQQRQHRRNQDRRQHPPLHTQVRKLEREVHQIHEDMETLKHDMNSLQDTVLTTSETNCEVISALLQELKALRLVESDDEFVVGDNETMGKLVEELQKQGINMDTEAQKTTATATSATPATQTTEQPQGMGPVTKGIIGGASLLLTFLAGAAFGSRRGYTKAMDSLEGADARD